MRKCTRKQWCSGTLAMLEHGFTRLAPERQTVRMHPLITLGNPESYRTIAFMRGRRKRPLIFSYCPFCGVLFNKLTSGVESK